MGKTEQPDSNTIVKMENIEITEGEETAPDSSESEGEDAKPTEEETKEDNSEES